MILNLDMFDILIPGGFSDVLINSESGKAYKLFISYHHPRLTGTGNTDQSEKVVNEYRKKVFDTEREAYELIKSSESVKQFTVAYFGHIHIQKVVQNDKDISSHYLLDCCLNLEYVAGRCMKIEDFRNSGELEQAEAKLNFQLDELLNQFKILGVKYTLDASVIYTNYLIKIIDFGTIDSWEFESIISP